MIRQNKVWLIFASIAWLLPASAQAQVNIAVAAPMSGPRAQFGQQIRMGVELAIEDINARGGVLGNKLILSIRDDEADRNKAIAVAKTIVNDGVKFVIGHQNSNASLFAAPIYASGGVLEITPGSTNPFLTEQGLWNIFRTTGRDDYQGTFAADYIAARFPSETAALVHDETPYGKLIFNAARLELQKIGFAHIVEFDVNSTTFEAVAVAAQIMRSNAGVVFWAGLEKNFAQVITEARAKGYKAIMIGPDSIASPEFMTIGGLSIEGVLMTMEGDPRRKHEAEAVTQKFTAKGFSPEAYAFNAYAAVQLIQQAAEIAHSIEPHAVAQALHSPRSFETVLGPMRFDRKGDLDKPNYILYEYNSDGRHVSYRPYTPN